MVIEMKTVYLACYCPCIYESSYATLSTHRTKLGAFKAMRAHKRKVYDEWYNDRLMYGKSDFKFAWAEDWKIIDLSLED